MPTENSNSNLMVPNLIVQKYGGATLADPQKIKQVAKRIFDLHKTGSKIVVIVSAMGETTNQLIALAHQICDRPSLRELDMLLTAGERISMSLLSIALNDLGCSAISFTGSQAGILTDNSHVNANIIEVKAFRVEQALNENKVVILAGFQGVAQSSKEITTLGRGGSDISAVAMAAYLKADRCEILKDVTSIFTADPKLVESAQPIPQLNYQHLIEMTTWGAKVLHHRSVQLASEKQVNLFVGAANTTTADPNGTLITSHIQFDHQFMLAINTFAHLYEICFTNENNSEYPNKKDDFPSYLQKNQIGQLQLLHSSSQQQKNKYYYTAPIEILNSLRDFEKQQNYFKITDQDLSSVSATFALPIEEKNITQLKELLTKNDIELIDSFKIKNSAHFLVKQQQKKQAIQILHAFVLQDSSLTKSDLT